MGRSFSGIQPTGDIHLGNYLGALRGWVKEQDEHECFFCIVDLHALTVPQSSTNLRAQTLGTAAMLLALGIDPLRSSLFVQSHVHEHAELAWIMDCLTSLGELRRMTQFKQKAVKGKETGTSVGLLTYPVLQAADILLYQADRVLVGEDQRQHLELARTLGGRFNHRFGHVFRLPAAIYPRAGARIMDLQNPRMKMSKSSKSPQGTIRLVDPPEVIQQKVRSAVTDSGREIVVSADKPAITNLLTIFAVLSGTDAATLTAAFAGWSYEQFKAKLAEALIEILRPIRERYLQWMKSQDELVQHLVVGAERAASIAYGTMSLVQERLGLLQATVSSKS
jgi:tryptophanyl-tRNA synthetase